MLTLLLGTDCIAPRRPVSPRARASLSVQPGSKSSPYQSGRLLSSSETPVSPFWLYTAKATGEEEYESKEVQIRVENSMQQKQSVRQDSETRKTAIRSLEGMEARHIETQKTVYTLTTHCSHRQCALCKRLSQCEMTVETVWIST